MSIRLSGTPAVLLASMVAVAGLFVAAPAAFAGFSSPTQFGVGTGPETITIGDLNGDGDLDMVTPNSSLGNVSVLLGDGEGSFGPKADFTVGTGPTSAAIADLNQDDDSFPDLAVTNSSDGTISILLGDGTGSFSAPTNLAAGTYPVAVAAGNLDADDTPYLVVANQNSGDVSVLIGNGDGTFATTTIPTGSGARSVAIGDLNDDGDNDLAVASSGTNKATILLGNGDGTFLAPVDFDVGLNPFSVALGDLDGDGLADLAVANNLSSSVGVLLNDGAGGFGEATSFAVGSFPRSVAIGNLVGDDALDLVVANGGSGFTPGTSVSVFAGAGDGNFAPVVEYPAGSQPSGVAIGDLDPDQNLDLAVASYGEAKASVLLNLAPTATASPSTLTFADQGLDTDSAPLPVAVTNSSGGDPLNVSGYSIEGANAGDFAVNTQNCTSDPVPLDDGCLMQVGFTPSALGARTATLKISYDGADSPLTVSLAGSGTDITPPEDPTPVTGTFTVDTLVPPQPDAKIGKVTIKGPAKATKGKQVVYKVTVENTGEAAATGVTLKVSGKGVILKRTIGRVAAGGARSLKAKVRLKKAGTVKLAFKVTSSNAGTKTAKKKVKVRK